VIRLDPHSGGDTGGDTAVTPTPINNSNKRDYKPFADGSQQVSTPTEVSLTAQAPLTGVASQFSARRQLEAVHGSSSVRLAMHQHTRVYIPKYF